MKKIFLFLILGLILINSVAAIVDHSAALVHTVASRTQDEGVKFIMNNNTIIFNVSIHMNSTATKCHLLDGSQNFIKTADIIEHNCTMNYAATAYQSYYVITNASGAGYSVIYSDCSGAECTFPITGVNLNFTAGYDRGNGAANELYQITAIETGENVSTTSATINITLNYPSNNSLLSTVTSSFNYTLNITGDNPRNYSWVNTTVNIWYSNGSIFNQSTTTISGNNTNANFSIDSFTLNNYLWNAYSCYANATFNNCTWTNAGNFSFTVGSSLVNISYSNETYETALEDFIFTVNALEGSEVSFAYLVYNGTNYTISNISYDGSNYIFSRSIGIPLNNDSTNQTNNFYLSFTYAGSFVQNFPVYYQNSSFIILQICDATYDDEALNFTLFDEKNFFKINATTNPTTFQSTFNYWVGDGSIYKNYSYQLINSSTNANYSFCIYPWPINYNKTLKTTMTSTYSAYSYSEREYNLYNSTLTNTTSDIVLYLLSSADYQKFSVTVKEGITNLPDAIVTVSKYFLGDGTYKTISIRKTDNLGQFVEYFELDRDYRYYINVDGVLRATIDKRASCSAAPCEMTLQIDGEQGFPFSGYYDYFSNGTLSNLTYDPDTRMVTYNFYDLTGLAHYFRLVVEQINLNETQGTICDSYSFSSSGTLTCNVTGYSGDFIARGYISRSPEKIDKVISFVIGDLIDVLGKLSLFVCFLIILTVSIAGGVISQGNPSGVLAGFGLSILICKLITIFPFSWIVVSIVELIVIALLIEVKSR